MNRSKIAIPNRFEEKLDQESKSFIYSALQIFSPLYRYTTLEFFPEYTDHGIEHVEDVIACADLLITDESFEELNSKDITVLILSILLHDIGMYISVDGIEKLIKKDITIDLDKKTWSQIWNDFFESAKRYNSRQKKNIFGEEEVDIRQPDNKDLSYHSRLLYGEFIRQNHPRLAHEIAVSGFPMTDYNLSLPNSIDKNIIDIAGLVARSHGMEIRETFSYLKAKYQLSWYAPHGVKIIYLMVLLRIADYIQIGKKRANIVTLKAKKFSSPFSIQEFEKNQSIEHINYNTDDPELIYVHCNPRNSKELISIEELLKDIQKEIDLSWAILGEVYGRRVPYSNLGIKYRRIRSNLDDRINAKEEFNFIPKKVSFLAEPEVLKLLIFPLYGNNPNYGIRELLQNSIDACFARDKLISIKEESDYLYEPSIDINILTEDNKIYLEIKDNGIGMNEDTLINYFFKVGASFAKSPIWLKELTDENHKGLANRSGRFGIGILSAFLLGPQIEVSTRYLNDTHGYHFLCGINDEIVEVKKIEMEIGTTTKILLTEKSITVLSENDAPWYDMFFLNFPDLNANTPFNWGHLRNKKDLLYNSKSIYWNCFKEKVYDKICWTYSFEGISCNGIKIPIHEFSLDNNLYLIKKSPHVLIFDKNGKLPITLDRTRLIGSLNFKAELVEDIYKDIIAYLLITKNTIHFKNDELIFGNTFLDHPSTMDDINLKSNKIIVSKSGYTIAHSQVLKKLNIKKLHNLHIKLKNPVGIVLDKNDDNQFYIINLGDNPFSQISALLIKHNGVQSDFEFKKVIRLDKSLSVSNSQVLIQKGNSKSIMSILLKQWNNTKPIKNSVLISDFDNTKTELKPQLDGSFLDCIEELILDYSRNEEIKGRRDVFGELLEKYLGENPLIPFSLDERKKKFPYAFKELSNYMAKYLS